jgi:hypothetical protein
MFFVMFAQAEGTSPIADYRGSQPALEGIDSDRRAALHD